MVQNPQNKADRDKLPRISVDFNTMDAQRRVHIPTHIHKELLNILKPKLRIIVFEEKEFEVEAILEFDRELSQQLGNSDMWFALPDWATIRDYNEVTGQYE